MTDQLRALRTALGNHYRIERVIGGGGMATVYLAQDLKHDRHVAIKVMRPEIAAALGVDRFLREISIASKLSHPHIVPVYDSGQADGLVYFTMPFVEGESLRARLNREQRLSTEEALQIAREVAAALSYAHQRGVIHRDIKPENILLSGGEAVVADFGIARAVSAAGGSGLTATGAAIGTPGYMSPEQAAGGRNLDGRSDLYSLGCVLHEMLLGRPPGRWLHRDSLETGQITDAAPEERARLNSLPEVVEPLLVKALAADPDQRFADADAFISDIATPTAGLGLTPAAGVPRARRVPAGWLARIGLATLAVAILAYVIAQSGSGPELDQDLIAVAPFDVVGADLAPWREGVVDLLSATLDGAGPLRAVPPSVVIRRWQGRADEVAAASLGTELGAGLVLYGRLIGAGTDSVRAVAALLDVRDNRTIAEFDLRDQAERVDRLADSLAVRLMSDLSGLRPLSGWQLASLGSSSPAAIKAFLQGERHYRAFALDSALPYYERAIALDSMFALPHARRAVVRGWDLDADPSVTPSLLRAGELNHGLARRESLLIVADSISGALTFFVGDSIGWLQQRRLFATLELAALQYPSDPMVWYELGEARYHYGPFVGVTDREAYDAFTRAVALDSAFVPAYRHLIELTLLLDGRDGARRVAELYAARNKSPLFRSVAHVTAALLDPERAASPGTQDSLEALTSNGFYQVWFDVKWWVDSAETNARVARAWVEATDSAAGLQSLALALAYRGHLQDALELIGSRAPALYAVLARLGGLPSDSADAHFADWLNQRAGAAILHGHRWWAQQRDTVSLRRAVAYWDSLVTAVQPVNVLRMQVLAAAARAYLALAQADTAEALRRLEALPVWPNRYYAYYEQLTRAQILARLGRDHDAAGLLDRMPLARQYEPNADAVVIELERGRVHERLGNREAAIRAYAFVIDAWNAGDPELQPTVEEARTALARLVGEERR